MSDLPAPMTSDGQLALFDSGAMAEWLEAKVKARREVTGDKVYGDPELLDAVISARLVMSERRVAEITRLDRATIRAVMKRAEADGKVQPLKEEVAGDIGRFMRAGWRQLADDVEEGRLPSLALPIPLGIAADKYPQFTDQAAQVIEHRHTFEVADFRRAFLATIDAEATVEALPLNALEQNGATDGAIDGGQALPAGGSLAADHEQDGLAGRVGGGITKTTEARNADE